MRMNLSFIKHFRTTIFKTLKTSKACKFFLFHFSGSVEKKACAKVAQKNTSSKKMLDKKIRFATLKQFFCVLLITFLAYHQRPSIQNLFVSMRKKIAFTRSFSFNATFKKFLLKGTNIEVQTFCFAKKLAFIDFELKTIAKLFDLNWFVEVKTSERRQSKTEVCEQVRI